MDPGNKTVAALDFRHITQKECESAFRLERMLQIAFGRDPETRDILMYGKLQDGLKINLVSKAPAISGAQSYKEFCVAAKNEERELTELQTKEQYIKESSYYETKENIQQQSTRF